MRFLSFLSLVFSMLVGTIMLSAVVWMDARLSVDGFDVVAPPRAFMEMETTGSRSVVNIPVSLPISRLENELKDQIPDRIMRLNENRDKCVDHTVDLLIVQPNITISCKITGVIRKDGDLQISSSDGELVVRLPINFRVTVEATSGLLKGTQETVRGAITVVARIVPRLRPNWNFAVDMETNFRWRERAIIDVFGFQIDLSRDLRPEINNALDSLKPEITSLLNSLNIKRDVTAIWREVQAPQRIATGPNVWLSVTPKSVHFSGFNIGQNTISARIAVQADTNSVVGQKPEVDVQRRLPNLQEIGDLPSGFNVQVPVIVQYRAIQRLLAAQEIGSRLVELVDPETYSMDLTKFDVYPNGEALVIGFDYATDGPGALFDAEGRAYISGVPRVNWNRKLIRFEGLTFTGAANNAVIDTASLIVSQGPVIRIAEENAIIPFEYEFIALTQEVNDALQRDFGDGVSLRGELAGAAVDHIAFTEEGLRLLVTLKGDLALRVAQ